MSKWYQAVQVGILAVSCSFFGGEEVRVVPVSPTPEPNTVRTRLVFPRPFENKAVAPINVQVRIEGFPLGVMTQNDRMRQLDNSPDGQAIHVIVDNRPYLSFSRSLMDSFDQNREYYDKIVSFGIPFSLNPGQHILRVFPVRSYGESLKGSGTFSADIFYFQDKGKGDQFNIDLDAPYLTYNEPQGRFRLKEEEPLLLDFLLSNCAPSEDGFKVRLSIDGKEVERLTTYCPYYLYGLSAGKHRIKLELLDGAGAVVPGFFNVVEREIEVEREVVCDCDEETF